jgi:hypothetical protein
LKLSHLPNDPHSQNFFSIPDQRAVEIFTQLNNAPLKSSDGFGAVLTYRCSAMELILYDGVAFLKIVPLSLKDQKFQVQLLFAHLLCSGDINEAKVLHVAYAGAMLLF